MTLDEFLHLYPDMAAGTHNNNGAVWSSVASDTVYDTPRICYEHSVTYYSECRDTTFTHYIDPYYIWVKYDSMPWYRPNVNRIKTPMNIFPILDTLFGTPCATVSNLQAVAVYDLSGRRMTEQSTEGLSAMMDVSALPRGTYIVAIRTLQGVATKKLVVE